MSEQPNAVVYAFSVKLETTAKGLITPTVHVYANDAETAKKQAVELFLATIADLKNSGQQVATEVKA
ncbi:MAG: hypothetical protein QXJ74_06125 [Nitrososphaera sp.]